MALQEMLATIGTVDELAAAVRSLPWAAHALAAGGLVSGLILWCIGRKVLKPIYATIAGLAGGAFGFFGLPLTGLDYVASIPSPYVGLAIGGVLGLVIGVALYRFAVAVSFGAAAGLAGILISATALNLQPQAREATRAAIAALEQQMADVEAEHAAAVQPAEPPSPEAKQQGAAQAVADQAKAFLSALGEEFSSRWAALQAGDRIVVLGSGAFGIGLGVILGLIMPVRSAMAVTAMFGSAVWLVSAVWLLNAVDSPGRELLDRGAAGWLVIWTAVALIGFIVQRSGLPGKKSPDK